MRRVVVVLMLWFMHRWMALFGADDDWERENPPVSRRDWVFALSWWGLLAVSMELVRSFAEMSGARPWWVHHLLMAVSCVPLVLRRWCPYAALLLGFGAFFVTLTWGAGSRVTGAVPDHLLHRALLRRCVGQGPPAPGARRHRHHGRAGCVGGLGPRPGRGSGLLATAIAAPGPWSVPSGHCLRVVVDHQQHPVPECLAGSGPDGVGAGPRP